ncbi:hypothetical protein B5V01_00135 [Mesorhizobium erdmanii]|uniref:Transposase IS116/IS110/IS902 C-terminal domain-containing protein n=2 Tax=Mesorhizobium TaxID=68287 RepID=A0A3M9X0T9_9HYPH|nr:hypothetical protein DNR46_33690 [Mesorhizobium japonicum]RXT53336.1 hypothetical protein B5V01_00135 [Mesorhizobium erdmanii]
MALINAVVLVAEVGDFTRFSSPHQLMAYFGLSLASNRVLDRLARRHHQNRQHPSLGSRPGRADGCPMTPRPRTRTALAWHAEDPS